MSAALFKGNATAYVFDCLRIGGVLDCFGNGRVGDVDVGRGGKGCSAGDVQRCLLHERSASLT